MPEALFIKKIAVLGAGVMGAQIAALCVNAGFETLLFDLAADETNKNAIVDKALKNLTKLKPSPLGNMNVASRIEARNYEQNLKELLECDLIIEAIAERLDIKESLYKKISPYINDNTIVVTNTSGLGINTLAKQLPENRRTNFCGVHFFNPPRYMHLVELIPHESTDSELLNKLETWLTSYLGKGVIRAKDTPNFIANRIGVFSLLITLYHAENFKIPLDTVDALTGTLLGRPKSATFRTMDVVGLDTMAHVVHTMREELRDDPWHEYFKLPQWLMELIKNGNLGQKTGGGVYRKNAKVIEVYDAQTQSYVPVNPDVSQEIVSIFKLNDPQEIMSKLFTSKDNQAQFLAMCFRDLFQYCAFHLEHIAEKVSDVDLAMRWGFGWNKGPFETWQDSGVEVVSKMLEQAIHDKITLSQTPLAPWVETIKSFYTEQGSYSPELNTYIKRNLLSVYKKQIFSELLPAENKLHAKILFENEGVRLVNLKDKIGVLSFKSKANTIGQSVVDGINQSLDYAEKNLDGLIIYQEDPLNFSSGANLKAIAELIESSRMQDVEKMVSQFQDTVLRIKYSPIPVVGALRGRALGGGCELLLHCDSIESAFESYPGLVEVGVGVIPAGGGCTQMALRASNKALSNDIMQSVRPYYEQIATGKVAQSAIEAQDMGYLKLSDSYAMHKDEVLFNALEKLQYLIATNYKPPLALKFRVGGIEGKAQLQIGLVNWLKGGFISEYDYEIGRTLAHVICGGDVNQNTYVDEKWMLKLELDAFISLLENSKTQDRINYLLKTGKPLRN